MAIDYCQIRNANSISSSRVTECRNPGSHGKISQRQLPIWPNVVVDLCVLKTPRKNLLKQWNRLFLVSAPFKVWTYFLRCLSIQILWFTPTQWPVSHWHYMEDFSQSLSVATGMVSLNNIWMLVGAWRKFILTREPPIELSQQLLPWIPSGSSKKKKHY